MVLGVVAAVVLVVLSVVLLEIGRRRDHFKFFKKLNIKGPEPSIFFGNILEYAHKEPHLSQVEWSKKYGETYGFFLGWHPFLVSSNLEFLKYVQIKNAPNFVNRNMLTKSAGIPIDHLETSLVFNEGETWKLKRSILNPTFSSGKLKQITYLMNQTIGVFMDKLGAASGSPMDALEHYSLLTLDNILRTAFGTEANIQLNPHNKLHNLMRNLTEAYYFNPVIVFCLSFPTLGNTLINVYCLVEKIKKLFGQDSFKDIVEICQTVLESRKTVSVQPGRRDLLQLMLEAKAEDPEAETLNEKPNLINTAEAGNKSSKLSESEIIGNSILFLAAGEDTTAALLSYSTYLLASHPLIQEKLRQEIQDHINEEETPEYNLVAKMPFLDQVIKESLRLYPSTITFITRKATEEFEYEGRTFPKGITVLVPNYGLHRDPRYWEEPDTFKPERFAPENKSKLYPMAYQPFGEGPRNCIGSRFALTFAKLTMIRILQHYKLEHSYPVQGEICLKDKMFVLHPEKFYINYIPISHH